MMDKKEREREKRRREEDKRGLIWSYRNSVGFIGTLPIDHWKRSKARREEIGIDIYIYTTLRDKTANFRKASVFLRDVHSSGLKWRIPLERRPEKDESTRARPSTVPYRRANQRVTRSYVPRGVHDEWMEKARLETEWQDAKLWIPPNSTTTTAHERTLPRIRAVSSFPSLPLLPLSASPPFTRLPQPSLPRPPFKLPLFFASQFHLQPGTAPGTLNKPGNWPRWSPST